MKSFITNYLTEHQDYFQSVSTFIYEHPETRFEETQSANFLANECEAQGFTVRRGIANIPTAFQAVYGSGKPMISFLGEYDALPNLSQQPNRAIYEPLEHHVGHGCGHNLLGTGSFAAACATKAYLEKNNLPGTVIFFGCPGEEGGSGKTFMAREGVFQGVDAALTWHPSPSNSIMNAPSLANYQIAFQFKGVAAHAANSPHLGRSALDAVELMNVGVNYLREHIIPEARLHYAVTDTGGFSPNVVQPNATVVYLIRAPHIQQVREIYERVCNIAKGAAMMTGTEVNIEMEKACSNYVPNQTLEKLMHEQFESVGATKPTEDEIAFAKNIWDTLTGEEQGFAYELIQGFGFLGSKKSIQNKYLLDFVSPYEPSKELFYGSTDVADVSWNVPTAQLTVATSAMGTPLHTWQMTSQGISSFSHKGMLRAATVMALTGLRLFECEKTLQTVQAEFAQFQQENKYINPIPRDIEPTTLQGKKVTM